MEVRAGGRLWLYSGASEALACVSWGSLGEVLGRVRDRSEGCGHTWLLDSFVSSAVKTGLDKTLRGEANVEAHPYRG